MFTSDDHLPEFFVKQFKLKGWLWNKLGYHINELVYAFKPTDWAKEAEEEEADL